MYSDIHWCSLDGGSVQLEHSIIAAVRPLWSITAALAAAFSSLQQPSMLLPLAVALLA